MSKQHMFLQYVRMQQFGAFANRTVGPFTGGMNVVYGSNEAGKTTLASFIEGVMFGWPEARGTRNSYKPEVGERAGWLQFAETGSAQDVAKRKAKKGASCAEADLKAKSAQLSDQDVLQKRLSRVRNADGLQGNVELVTDIDRETYRTMFWLTSDQLRRLENTTDVTARLLTAGSGTSSSPALALSRVRDHLAAYTSRAASETESLLNLSAEIEAARAAMVQAQEREDLLREESKELASLEPERANLSSRMDDLSYQIERLSSWSDRIAHLEKQISEEREQLSALSAQEAQFQEVPDVSLAGASVASTQTNGFFESGQETMAVSATQERKIRSALDSLAAEEAKHEHAVDMARDDYTTSKARYEALVEAQGVDRSGQKFRQRMVKMVLGVALPLVFLLAGIPLFVHGRQINSLSFTALGAGLVAIAVLIGITATFMLLRPSKLDEDLQAREQDSHWVMLQDKKKLEATQQESAAFSEKVQQQLSALGLGDAGASIRQARSMLEQAVEARNDLQLSQQRKQAIVSRKSELEANLCAHEEELVGLYEKVDLSPGLDRSVAGVRSVQEQKMAQRQALRETSEKMNRRCGELEQKLNAALGTHTFDEAKLHYQELQTRFNESRMNYARLLLARRMLEESIAAWESKSQPEVYKQASRLMALITDGAWVKVQMNDEGQLQVVNSVQEVFSPVHLSLGTCQQLYLALRIALLIAAENVGSNVPVVADDILVNFDSKRRRGAAKALMELAQHRQVIMLTCHEEIVKTMQDASSDINEVRL